MLIKRSIALFLCVCCLLSMTACAKDSTAYPTETDYTVESDNGNPNYCEEQVPPDAR